MDRGFENAREQTEWRDAARNMGYESNDDLERMSIVLHDFQPGGYDEAGDWHSGSMDVDDLKELWMEMEDIEGEYDDSYDDDFYEWLREFYDNT